MRFKVQHIAIILGAVIRRFCFWTLYSPVAGLSRGVHFAACLLVTLFAVGDKIEVGLHFGTVQIIVVLPVLIDMMPKFLLNKAAIGRPLLVLLLTLCCSFSCCLA